MDDKNKKAPSVYIINWKTAVGNAKSRITVRAGGDPTFLASNQTKNVPIAEKYIMRRIVKGR